MVDVATDRTASCDVTARTPLFVTQLLDTVGVDLVGPDRDVTPLTVRHLCLSVCLSDRLDSQDHKTQPDKTSVIRCAMTVEVKSLLHMVHYEGTGRSARLPRRGWWGCPLAHMGLDG